MDGMDGTTRQPQANLADPRFWQLPAPQREEAFARLRAQERPAHFSEGRDGRGFHALVRHADVVAASRNPQLFLSGPGVTTPEPARWVRTLFGDSMVNMDGADHAQLRRIVSKAFTPRLLNRVEDDIRATAARIVADVAASGGTQVICRMMGIPEREQRLILDLVNRASENTGVGRGLRDRVHLPGRGLRALAHLQFLVARVGRQRLRDPQDDLISALVQANLEGRRLNSRQLGAFFSLLLVAGVETTRNALAHGLHLLSTHPEQRAALTADMEGRMDGAMEEVVRYCSPIIQFRRTLAQPHELGGHRFAAGDKVVLYFASANRDETVFKEPDTFDISRDPNPHLGFGGGGPHFCLGAHLARQEMRALFRELYTQLPDARSTDAPQLIPSSFDHRVRALPYATRAARI